MLSGNLAGGMEPGAGAAEPYLCETRNVDVDVLLSKPGGVLLCRLWAGVRVAVL